MSDEVLIIHFQPGGAIERISELVDRWRIPRVGLNSRTEGLTLVSVVDLIVITFYDFHIHTATERYQEAGYAEEHYAEPTDRYADLSGAIQCLIQDCAFELPPGTQGSLL